MQKSLRVDKVPEGFRKQNPKYITSPNGYTWYNNGKSRFSGEYKSVLVKNEI